MRWRRNGAAPDDADWLGGCVGFAVEGDGTRVGHVEEVEHDTETGRPVALVVAAGPAGGAVCAFPSPRWRE